MFWFIMWLNIAFIVQCVKAMDTEFRVPQFEMGSNMYGLTDMAQLIAV